MAVLHNDSLQPDGLHGDSLRGDQGCAVGLAKLAREGMYTIRYSYLIASTYPGDV